MGRYNYRQFNAENEDKVLGPRLGLISFSSGSPICLAMKTYLRIPKNLPNRIKYRRYLLYLLYRIQTRVITWRLYVSKQILSIGSHNTPKFYGMRGNKRLDINQAAYLTKYRRNLVFLQEMQVYFLTHHFQL